MSVIGKFQCVSVEDQPSCENKQVTLTAVVSGSEENKSFAKYTPSGTVQMAVSYDTPACEFFVQGETYYLAFDKAL